MPTFIDHASHERDARSDSIRALPLPRRGTSEQGHGESKPGHYYDVIVVGAGPAGLFLTLLLARYGLEDSQVLCLERKNDSVRAGQADGLQPRTLEVFQSLGLADELLREAGQMWEVAFWNPGETGVGIERTSVIQDIGAPARYAQEFTVHQGRIERILKEDLARYSERGVRYGCAVEAVGIDGVANNTYPVEVELRDMSTNVRETVRAKHIVGCDGARSSVREHLGLELRGDSKDHIWGVIDLVVDTDFPDIRRRCAIQSAAGSVMVIPRERVNSGDYLTRLYVQMDDVVAWNKIELDAREQARQMRARISAESLLERAQAVLQPFSIAVKRGTNIDWWAAYQIGQRLADSFCVKDEQGLPRAFIAGDACHTHSPKAGQGMNVSMMDSYNLAWKLAYHLKGLTADGISLLASYEHERRKIASELIDFDTRFSTVFSQAMGAQNGTTPPLTHLEFESVFTKINEFTTGCGIEYLSGQSIWQDHAADVVTGDKYLHGILRPGRRLLDVRVIRHADSAPWHLQDDFLSTGRFGLLVLTSSDLLNPNGESAAALQAMENLLARYPSSLLQTSILHCLPEPIRGLSWSSLPPTIKSHAEMRFHSARPNEAPTGQLQNIRHVLTAENAYEIYGVDPGRGALVAIRPDGYVGVAAALADSQRVRSYLDGLLIQSQT